MKKSVLMMSMAAAILALTGCAANKGAQQTQDAEPATATQEQAPAAVVPAEKLDGALCLFVDAHPQAKPYNDAVQQGVASLMPDVQTFSDPKAAPEVCQKGYIMAYGIKGKEVTDGKTVKGKDGKPVKGKKAATKHVVPDSIMFAVFHDNKNVLHGEGPLKLQNNQIDLNQVSAYSQEMTNALLAKYKDGTLGKEEAPAAADDAAAPTAATPAPAIK